MSESYTYAEFREPIAALVKKIKSPTVKVKSHVIDLPVLGTLLGKCSEETIKGRTLQMLFAYVSSTPSNGVVEDRLRDYLGDVAAYEEEFCFLVTELKSVKEGCAKAQVALPEEVTLNSLTIKRMDLSKN